jgi:hypothetical protein
MAYDSTNTGAEVDAAIAKVRARSGDLIDGSGNATKIAKFSATNTVTDSIITDSGSALTVAGDVIANTASLADGSESAPSITNTGDSNTGLYFPTENSIALTAGAGAKLTCSTSAITIERPTTVVSTAQTELTLQGGDANSKNLIFKKASAQQGKITAVGDELKFYAGTSGTESLEITTTGVVVPGTISVDGLIKQSGDTGFLDLQGGDTAGANIELYGASHASHSNDAFYDADSHNFRTANGPPTNVVIDSSGNVGIGVAAPGYKFQVSEASTDFAALITNSTSSGNGLRINAGDNTGDRVIELNDKDGNSLMRVGATGLVGIGTESPSKLLHVKSSNSDTAETVACFGNGDIERGLEIKTNGNGGSSLDWGFNAVNSRNLVFDTNQIERMRISSAGNIGIGDNDPSKELVVKNSSTAGTESVINIISGNAAVAGLYLGDSDDDIVAGIVYDNSADTLQLRSSNNQTAVTIDSSERVGIGTTTPDEKLDVNGAGRFSTGVTFGTDTAAANKLDDYQEGSWIPTISFGGASVDVEYNLQVGRYTKIGDLVTASCYMALADIGTSTGNAVIDGLPFASNALIGGLTPATLRLQNISFADIPMGYNGSSTTTIIFQESTNAGTVSTLTNGNFSDTSIVNLSISYRV